MTVKVGLVAVLLTLDGALVVLCNNLFSIRIKKAHLFAVGIAGIPYCKVGTGFLCNQNRQLILYMVFSCCHKCGRVRSNRKLTNRKRLMVEQDIILNQLPVFFFCCKVCTTVIGHSAVLKP